MFNIKKKAYKVEYRTVYQVSPHFPFEIKHFMMQNKTSETSKYMYFKDMESAVIRSNQLQIEVLKAYNATAPQPKRMQLYKLQKEQRELLEKYPEKFL